MKNFVKFLSAAAVVAVLLTGCEKEQAAAPESNGVITSGINPNTEASADDLLRVDRTIENSTKKGRDEDYSSLVSMHMLNLGVATDASNNQYKTLRINKPDGYFYIMIENLKYSDGKYGSWPYEYNNSNVQKYGRLYFWEKANEFSSTVYMDVPQYPYPGAPTQRVVGKLPTVAHFQALLGKFIIPSHPTSSGMADIVTLDNMANAWYFDTFVFGIAKTGIEGGFHSLGGRRENLEVAPDNIPFTVLNGEGYFWTRNTKGLPPYDSHYPLQITYKTFYDVNYNYSAFINAEHVNHFGYSVRYVFDPFE